MVKRKISYFFVTTAICICILGSSVFAGSASKKGSNSTLTASCWQTICGADMTNNISGARFLETTAKVYNSSGGYIGAKSNSGAKNKGVSISATYGTSSGYKTVASGSIHSGNTVGTSTLETLNVTVNR